MSEERFDFSALDPSLDPERRERLVGSIMARARHELARRALVKDITPFDVVAAWYRPALAAAALVAAVSLTLLATVERRGQEIYSGAYMSGAEVPVALTSWYEEGNLPTAAELMVAANQGGN